MVLTLSYAEHDGYLLDVFNNYFEKGSFMDVRFVCKGNKITFAHKLVVASVSKLLRKLISEMTCKDEVMTIYLPEVNSNTLNLFLTFLYEGVMKLDAAELNDFKDVCNLLCVEIPNAEISEVRRECVSPPAVPPSLAQRLERMSSHNRAVPKKTVAQTTTMQTSKSNISEDNYKSVVVKQEIGNDTMELPNLTGPSANIGQVQSNQETEEEINISKILPASEGTSRTQLMNIARSDFEAENVQGGSNEPPDISTHCMASGDVAFLAISNVISLSSGPMRKRCQGHKRTRTAQAQAKPKKEAKKSLPSEKE